VVQWTTGITGASSVRAILDDPRYELVGLFAHGADKVGVDAGELVDRPATGVVATNDAASLFDLKPDCVVYMPRWPDLEELAAILRHGINVVTTARIVTGARYPNGKVLEEAALEGGASLYGTGGSPMHVQNVVIAASAIGREITNILIEEKIDGMMYSGTETWQAYGFGGPPNPELVKAALLDTEPDYLEMLDVLAESVGAKLDSVDLQVELATAVEDRDLGFMAIPKGTVAAFKSEFVGYVGDTAFTTFRQEWHLGTLLGGECDPPWELDGIGHDVTITGDLNINLHLDFLPPDIFDMDIGIPVALPALNAIPTVCAAQPGIVTCLNMPAVTGRAALRLLHV
jgi:hypothetical protein